MVAAYLQGSAEAAHALPFAYRVFGLRLRSDIALPELIAAELDFGEPDVSIRSAKLPPMEGERFDGFAAIPAGAIINVPNAARYLIRGGSEIIVDADPDGSERHLRLYLLGSALGALLHQRNLLPLHANSIEIAGRAVAFMGHSGAGKSTMAAWFYDQGFEILADDVCVVTIGEGATMAQPGIPRLRMWRDALEASGRSAEAYELSFDDAEKYNVPTRTPVSPAAIQLGAVYLLKKLEADASKPLIEPLRGIDALEALVANTYRGAYVRLFGGTKAHLASCMALAKSVPVFAVHRRWGKEHLEEQFRQIEEHARSIATG